jgi:20S proteasome subunit alpha 7
VLAVEQTLHSPLLESVSAKQIRAIDSHLGVAATGLLPDARQLTRRARGEARDYRSTYGSASPVHVVAQRLAAITHNYTLHSYMRPWGAAALVAGVDNDGPALWLVETSGKVNGFYAAAIGKGARQCKSELEKLKLADMTCAELVRELTRIVYFAHDDAKEQEKPFTVELGWCLLADRKFAYVPADVKKAAVDAAQAALNARDQGSDDDADLDA